MKVAIGIPTYKQANYIKEAIDSGISQSYDQLSVFVADDQSPDETESVCKGITAANLFYFRNKDRLGRLGNYRKLLNDYAGDAHWYLNLDGDDYLVDKNFIQHAVTLINNNNPDDISFFQANHNLGRLKKIFTEYKVLTEDEILVDGKDYFRLFYKIRNFSHAATLYNRNKALGLNFYSYDSLSSDFHSLMRLSLTGKVILSGKNVAYWRLHDNNDSQSLNEQSLVNELRSLEGIADFSLQFLTKQESRIWLKRIRRYYKESFIYFQSKVNPGTKTIRYVLKNGHFSLFYLKCLVKNIINFSNKKSS